MAVGFSLFVFGFSVVSLLVWDFFVLIWFCLHFNGICPSAVFLKVQQSSHCDL